MKKIFLNAYVVVACKHTAARAEFLLGTAFTNDTHAILRNLSTPFFPRR